MAPGRVAAFLPLALGRSLAPSNSPVSCRLECFRSRHAGPVEKGQQLGGPQPGDARVWVDPHVEVAQAAPADGSLFSCGGGVGRAAVAVDEACVSRYHCCYPPPSPPAPLSAHRRPILPAASADCSPRSHRELRPGHSPPAHPHTGKTASGQIQTPCLSRHQQPHRVPTPPPSPAPGPPPAPAGR